MWHRSAVFFIFILSGSTLYAQKKLNGTYDSDDQKFICTDTNIIVKSFVNGRAAFMIKGIDPFNDKNNKVGFIDTTGKVVIKPVYANCSDFWGDFALVQDTLRREAIINGSGKIIIPFAPQYISLCENGLFIKTNYALPRSISLVNSGNRTIVPFGKYASVATPPPPLYRTMVEGNDETYMPREFIWQQIYFGVVHFKKYIGVKTGLLKDGKWSVINTAGNEVIPPTFDWIGVFDNGLAPFRINKKLGITDTTGNQIIPPIYDNIELSGSRFAIAIQNKKSGVLSIDNRTVISFKYTMISRIGTGAFLVDTGKEYTVKFGVINNEGVMIIPIENRFVTQFGTGYLVDKSHDSTAVFDSGGIQKTKHMRTSEFNFPVWGMGDGKGYMVYNKRKRDFIYYGEVNDMMYKENDKWGLLDSAGEEVTKPQYDRFWYIQSRKVIAVEQNNKWCFIDKEGKEVIDDKFDEIHEREKAFYLMVKKDGRYGLFTNNLKLILPVKYDRIDVSGYGLTARISVIFNKKAGVFNWFGRETIPTKYDEITPYPNGFNEVMINKKRGLLNAKGNEVISCIYDSIQGTQFSLLIVSRNKFFGLINYSGKIILPIACNSIILNRLNGRPIFMLTRNGKTGMADTSGKQFLPFKYDYAYPLDPYSNVPADVLSVRNNGLYGVADLSGKIIVPTVYDQVVLINSTSKKCYEIVRDKKDGIADETGKVIIPCVYTYLSGITDRSMLAAKGGPMGVIDWKQKAIIPFIYENIEPCGSGYIVRSKGKSGATNLNGHEIIPIIYDYISGYFQNVFFLSKDRKMGIADDTGKIILPVEYDNITTCGTENVQITKNKLNGLIDYKGKVIYPCKYTFINCADGKVVEIY